MIEAFVVADPKQAAHRTRLGIRCAVDESGDAGIHERARTHGTGLEGHVHRRSVEPPTIHLVASVAQRDQLRVRPRVLVDLASIVAAPDDAALPDDDRPDRHITAPRRGLGESQRLAHEGDVVRHRTRIAFFCEPDRGPCVHCRWPTHPASHATNPNS